VPVPRCRRSVAGPAATRPALLLFLIVLAALGCQRSEAPAPADTSSSTPPSFAGAAACAGCHPKETEAYRASDHALAMRPATEQTVLGDFRDARFTHRGVTSTFFRRDGKFWVRTDGPDGKAGDFEIAYTFGARPLQQYLIGAPGGRLQALGIAWDTRPRSDGGQRWFHLYPGDTLRAPDAMHWTGRDQNWNYQCAECHSTDLRKNYDRATDTYKTAWAELTVTCEACHGPASAHVAWAQKYAGASKPPAGDTGLVARIRRPAGAWAIKDPARGIAEWSGAPRSTAEVDACARCHARRRPIADPYVYGRPFLDTHAPALLDAGLYHADGQILGEVYEYGSFLQSRMYRAGVTCSDCHDPHSLALRAPGNATCAACHAPPRFDTPEHHHHAAGTEAARCVSCHMPTRTYMGVDPRRDHSLRVPRPDLAAALGTPDACTGCHRDRRPQWAAEQVARWYGPTSAARRPHYAPAIDAGRRGLAGAEAALGALAADASQPGIARATALSLLPEYLSPASRPAVEAALRDPDPLVRRAALAALEALPPADRAPLAAPALADPIRVVRLAAAHALADVPRAALTEAQRADLDRALGELIASERVDADRPESRLNLALLYGRLGRGADAEGELRAALTIDPRFVPAMINLADLYRAQGREADAQRFLEQALAVAPDNAEALHALGLLRVREGKRAEAVDLFRRAAERRPESTRFAYVYAVALHDTGAQRKAIAVLEQAHGRRSADRAVLVALVTYLAERGDVASARRYAEALAAVSPDEGRRALDALSARPR